MQPIVQVDAFADRPFTGNPAAVCVLDAPASEEWMQSVAGEMNLSETAFLHPEGDAWKLRWFTPSVEVALCGHATLASAHHLWDLGRLAPDREARFETASGTLTARRVGEWIEMDFPAKPAHPAEAPPGLLDALGIEKAVFVGHDWGGSVIWQMGLRYPERVERLVGLNTPFGGNGRGKVTEALRDYHGLTDKTFYMRYFLQPGVAEAELEADVETTFRKVFLPYTRAEDFTTFMTVGGDGSGVIAKITNTDTFLNDEELAEYVRVFSRTGFRGGLNWYRGTDLNALETDGPEGPGLAIKSMMVTAGKDTILKPEMAAAMPMLIPGIRMEHIEDCAHWTQQERPAEVNALLLDFLGDLRGA
jgi:pimeloyl-ACP methyl ester carboxylesterase